MKDEPPLYLKPINKHRGSNTTKTEFVISCEKVVIRVLVLQRVACATLRESDKYRH